MGSLVDAKKAIKKAKKEIYEAEEATETAQKEVLKISEKIKSPKKKSLGKVALELEKAVCAAEESCESTDEAEFEIERI
jgi:GTP-binding protein EngB required for normal cell division